MTAASSHAQVLTMYCSNSQVLHMEVQLCQLEQILISNLFLELQKHEKTSQIAIVLEKWNGYYCTNENLAMVTFESMDYDKL
jgi:hypothetical protein